MKRTPENIMEDFRELMNAFLRAYFEARAIVGVERAQEDFKRSSDEFMEEAHGLIDMDVEHDRRVAITASVYLLCGVIICSGACENGGT